MVAYTIASAQNGDSTLLRLIPRQAIKVSPLHLLNFYPTLEVSYEFRIARRMSLQLETGYVLTFPSEENDTHRNKRGVKLKLEGRYFFPGVRRGEKIYYGAIEPYMNVINFDRYEAIEECFDADCRNMYVRRYGYRMTYREQGVSLKVGMVWYLGSHFFVDYNAGLTLRIVDYDRPPLLPESPDRFGIFTIYIPDETDRTAIGPNMGLRFGYRFP